MRKMVILKYIPNRSLHSMHIDKHITMLYSTLLSAIILNLSITIRQQRATLRTLQRALKRILKRIWKFSCLQILVVLLEGFQSAEFVVKARETGI